VVTGEISFGSFCIALTISHKCRIYNDCNVTQYPTVKKLETNFSTEHQNEESSLTNYIPFALLAGNVSVPSARRLRLGGSSSGRKGALRGRSDRRGVVSSGTSVKVVFQCGLDIQRMLPLLAA
jgi:hypothetical protein